MNSSESHGAPVVLHSSGPHTEGFEDDKKMAMCPKAVLCWAEPLAPKCRTKGGRMDRRGFLRPPRLQRV